MFGEALIAIGSQAQLAGAKSELKNAPPDRNEDEEGNEGEPQIDQRGAV